MKKYAVSREFFPWNLFAPEFDCLHDDGILYADLLRSAGVEVTLNETRGTMHGFDIATKAPTTLAAMEQRITFMKRMV